MLIQLHGPYFPKQAWSAIERFLKRGGGLLHVGGAPFRVPVYEAEGQWRQEHSQTGYHQRLNIHEVLAAEGQPAVRYAAFEDIPLFAGKEALFDLQPTVGLVLHVTKLDDHPREGGTSGPMDAHIYPLLKSIALDGREVAAPIVLLENTKGDFRGGRWIFINMELNEAFWNEAGIELIEEISAYCAQGVSEIWFKPNYASYTPGERALLTIQMQKLARASQTAGSAGQKADQASQTAGSTEQKVNQVKQAAASTGQHSEQVNQAAGSTELAADSGINRTWKFAVEVFKEETNGAKQSVWQGEATLVEQPELNYARLLVPVDLQAGYYEAVCVAKASDGEIRLFRQGFWGVDHELLRSGSFLTRDRDYFRRDGRPFPIVGMTYMTSDVARKFLLLPNSAVWDRDMAQMKAAGINYLRTGIWTAFRQMMFIDGHPYDEVLRAIDAFFLTAKKHGLEVTFTFFTFVPESWEGANPYLDPRSREAQKRFIASIVSRHAESTHVHWDLINEPSMFNPDKIFNGPEALRDPHERQAYAQWLRKRHNDDIRSLQESWNMTPEELPDFAAAVPPLNMDVSFRTTSIHPKKNAVWLDYTLFTMAMHNEWAQELTSVIRAFQPRQMVTVGQDEGLCSQRPTPFFYAEAVDYTTVHSWWQLDNLVWDSVFTKTLDKPNLIQETGIMFVETPEGKAKRSETEHKHILERKYAYAFATGGAGAVQWVWNTNFYMHNVNESSIGALRADGTEKPEAEVSYDFGRFIGGISDLFEERALEEVAVIFPYSNDFSTRKLAMDATVHLTRVMSYKLKQPLRAFGEYHLEQLADAPPKLIIVPSPHNFSRKALQQLVEHIETHGGTLLFTGPLGLDEYWREAALPDALVERIGKVARSNVRREEVLALNGRRLAVSFNKTRIAEVAKEVPEEQTSGLTELTCAELGAGKLIWCPLPVELNEHNEPLEELYRYALQQAGAALELEWLSGGDNPGVYGRKLSFREGALFIFISETAMEEEIEVRDNATGRRYAFTLAPERTVMFAAQANGDLRAVYLPEQTNLRVLG
ncbi:glycoside hydrolase [Paenibacillaceae bacterium]|nr:glycoside hydrolase [Paenibacillaceae bacterium]